MQMSEIMNPDETLDPKEDYTLDPSFQQHANTINERHDYWEKKDEADDIENAEAAAIAKEKEKQDRKVLCKAIQDAC